MFVAEMTRIVYYAPREEKTWTVHSSCKLPPEPKARVANTSCELANFIPVVRILFFTIPGPKIPHSRFGAGREFGTFGQGVAKMSFHDQTSKKTFSKKSLHILFHKRKKFSETIPYFSEKPHLCTENTQSYPFHSYTLMQIFTHIPAAAAADDDRRAVRKDENKKTSKEGFAHSEIARAIAMLSR